MSVWMISDNRSTLYQSSSLANHLNCWLIEGNGELIVLTKIEINFWMIEKNSSLADSR